MTPAEVGEVVNGIAKRLAGRTRWEEDDLVQTGWTAALSALERARRRGAERAHDYVAFAVWRELSGYLLWAGSPASAKRHDRRALVGLRRADEEQADGPSCAPTQEALLGELEQRARVRARIKQLAVEVGAAGWLQRELDERLAGRGVATTAMRRAKERTFYRARQDRLLRSLWEGDR